MIPDSGRWTARRKEDLLVRIRRGELSPEQAAAEADVSADELAEWRRRYKNRGKEGLKITRHQRSGPAPVHSPAEWIATIRSWAVVCDAHGGWAQMAMAMRSLADEMAAKLAQPSP